MSPPVLLNSNPLTGISNALIKGLNRPEQQKLPKHVIVLLDQNFVEYTHGYEDRLTLWLITEMWRQIVAKNELLPIKTRPSVLPTILLVKLLPVPA